MSWTDRQRAMLREIGVAVWWPRHADTPDTPAEVAQAAAPAQRGGAPSASAPVATAVPQHVHVSQPVPQPVPQPAPPSLAATAGQASPGPLSALGWPELRAAVAACTACGLAQTRTQTVFGTGHPQAQWLIVGEAPGEQEDLQGEPFVGAAGQLLDAMLRALKLTRVADGDLPPAQRVYIANTLKCRPPRNRNPQPGEMAACEPFLLRQVALLKPRLILAMGRFAIQALLRTDEAVGRLRGRVHQWQGIPLVVTYHPAYLLRNLPDKARAWDDLCLAAEVFERSHDPSHADATA